MKTKGLPWIEQHVEKVVVGVVGVALVGIVGLQVLYQPNRVAVGKAQDLAPDQAFKPAEDAARVLRGKVETENPTLPPALNIDLPKTLADRLSKPAIPAPSIAALGAAALVAEGRSVEVAAVVDYAPLAVPAPTGVVGATLAATIHPAEQVHHPDLAKVLPAAQPFDKVGVSVEGHFSGAALRDALLADPDGEGKTQPIPRGYWQDPLRPEAAMIDVVAVEMERELVRPALGSGEKAGATTVLSGMPGRWNSLQEWNTHVRNVGDVPSELGQIHQMAEQIQRPAYYALIAGQSWAEPAEMHERIENADQQAQIDRLQKQRTDIKGRLAQAEEELSRLPAPDPNQKRPSGGAAPPPPPPPGGGGGRGGGGRQGSAPPGPGPSGQPKKPEDPAQRRATLQSQIRNMSQQIKSIERRLGDLGVKLADAPAPGSSTPQPVAVSLLDDPDVRVWSHDMSATPGATYRYRLRIVVNNPLFGRALRKEQEGIAKDSLTRGAWSEWSEPVEVEPTRDFFIVSASASSEQSPQPAATADLFVFYYGQWRKASPHVTPGDTFVADIKVPALPIYDLKKVGEKFPAGQPLTGAAPAPSAPTGPDVRPGGGGRGRMAAPPELPPTAATAPPAGKPDPTEGVIKLEGVDSTPGPTSLAAGVDAIFLDTQRALVAGADLSGQSREALAAVLREKDGTLVLRVPEEESASPVFKRLEAMYRMSKLAKAPTNAPQQPGPTPPAPDRDRPPTRPGGGGGGSGGG
jgi:hypothetical protein